MKILAIIFLALIVLFIGGCSVFFAVLSISSQGSNGTEIIWGPGLLLALICIFAIFQMIQPKRDVLPKPSQPETNPTPDDHQP